MRSVGMPALPEGAVVFWDDEASVVASLESIIRTAENCYRCDEVASASSGRSRRDAEEDFGTGQHGGNADEEEEEFVVTDIVNCTVDVGKKKVDGVEETGADR